MSDSTGVLVRTRDDDLFTNPEALALTGFLAGYSGLTRDAYSLDLRLYTEWVTTAGMRPFDVRRAHIEAFARHLEAIGRARATIARRLGTIVCFYRYAEKEGLIEHSPAVHVRRPRMDYESHAIGLDRNELGAMLVAAGPAGARDHALISPGWRPGCMPCRCPAQRIRRLPRVLPDHWRVRWSEWMRCTCSHRS